MDYIFSISLSVLMFLFNLICAVTQRSHCMSIFLFQDFLHSAFPIKMPSYFPPHSHALIFCSLIFFHCLCYIFSNFSLLCHCTISAVAACSGDLIQEIILSYTKNFTIEASKQV